MKLIWCILLFGWCSNILEAKDSSSVDANFHIQLGYGVNIGLNSFNPGIVPNNIFYYSQRGNALSLIHCTYQLNKNVGIEGFLQINTIPNQDGSKSAFKRSIRTTFNNQYALSEEHPLFLYGGITFGRYLIGPKVYLPFQQLTLTANCLIGFTAIHHSEYNNYFYLKENNSNRYLSLEYEGQFLNLAPTISPSIGLEFQLFPSISWYSEVQYQICWHQLSTKETITDLFSNTRLTTRKSLQSNSQVLTLSSGLVFHFNLNFLPSPHLSRIKK